MTSCRELREPVLMGLVLAGGKSLRMQQPKAHLVINNLPQWHACERTLKPYCETVYFSVSPQLEPPLPVGADYVIHDIFAKPIGPLGGIISAFKQSPKTAFFVLACDLVFFNADAAKDLFEQRNTQKKATVYVNDGKVEPLCAIYEPSIINDVLSAYASGMYCPRALLSKLDIERIEPKDHRVVTNINHAHELKEVLSTQAMKTIKVYYYASLREQALRSEEIVMTQATTIADLFSELKRKYLWSLGEHNLRFAKNERLVAKDALLLDQDEVVFIPPVSGG